MITKKTVRANYTYDELGELLVDLLLATKAPEADSYEDAVIEIASKDGKILNVRVETTAIFTDQ